MKPLKTAETQLRDTLEGEGWEIMHQGWPDFACVRDGEMIFVEVKSYRGEMLRKEQHFILTNMAKLGLSCYKWSPDGGFEQITPKTPLPIIVKNSKRGGRRLTLEEKLARLSPEEQERIKRDETAGKHWYL